jgi:hypothetical protein
MRMETIRSLRELAKQYNLSLNNLIETLNSKGLTIKIKTFSGLYTVKSISSDCWVNTDGNAGFGLSWCCHADSELVLGA